MAVLRHLVNAPIVEALFDFRVSLPADFDPESFLALRDRLSPNYSRVDEIVPFETVVEVQDGKPQAPRSHIGALLGYRFMSESGLDIAQFRRDGFTLNRLAKYTSWEALCPEALRLWSVYVEVAKPEAIDRVAVRYINRLTLPPRGNLEDYLTVVPPMFPGAPAYLASFLTRQTRHDPVTGYFANIVQSLEPNLGANNSLMILDIDAYKPGGLSMVSANLERVLGDLRVMKNEIFFGAITDLAAREYE